MSSNPVIHDDGDMVASASMAIEFALREALSTRGSASLMVSGGSSPKPLYAQLSQSDLDWSKVTVSLVDERWVDPGQEARFAAVDQPFDVCVMGMGGDAHTASWFPNSKGLSNALSLENETKFTSNRAFHSGRGETRGV